MKENGKQNRGPRHILQRYRALPGDLRSKSPSRRASARRLLAASICVLLMLACGVYMICWERNRQRIEYDNASYRALYRPTSTATVESIRSAASAKTDAPTEPPVELKASAAPAATDPEMESEQPTPDLPSPTPAAIPVSSPPSTATAAPAATDAAVIDEPAARSVSGDEVAVDATRAPRATADEGTLVFSLETPPPVQESFTDLLALNPDTVGYLSVGESISLPVVQRRNDNEYYLNHSFEGEESLAGTLFLDGANLLVPEDDCLIVYGHNMRNGTMFHALSQFENTDFLRKNAVVNFDTLYENRLYVPFAAFTATMDAGSERYLDIRQFLFDEDSFELFVLKMEKLSVIDTPMDVRYGDRLLLLVTCEYLYDNGRFVVALRELRPNETEAQVRSAMRSATGR